MIHKQIEAVMNNDDKPWRIRSLLTHLAAPAHDLDCLAFGFSPAFLCTDLEGLILEMTAQSFGAVRSADTLHYVVFSWPAEERPSPEQAAEATDIFLRHIGFADHLYVWALHAGADHRHLHIVLDRTGDDGRVRQINGGFTRVAGSEAAALIEAAQGWRSENAPMVSMLEDGSLVRSATQRAQSDLNPAPPDHVADQAARDQRPTEIEKLQARVGDIFLTAASWQDIHDRLAKNDLRYALRGKGAILWVDDLEAVKASSVSRHAALGRLEKRLGPFSPARASAPSHPGISMIHAAEPTPLTAAFEAYHEAVRADRYRVTLERRDPRTGRRLGQILDRRAGDTLGLSADELKPRLPEIARFKADGGEVFLTPFSAQFHHLILDDLKGGTLSELYAAGVRPAVVLEAAPDQFQAVISIARAAPDADDKRAAAEIAQDFVTRFGTDPSRKPAHRHAFPGPRAFDGGPSPSTGVSFATLLWSKETLCLDTSKRLSDLYAAQRAETHALELPDGDEAPSDALYATLRHDLEAQFKTVDDLHRLDCVIAGQLAAAAFSRAKIVAVLQGALQNAPRQVKHPRPYDYARRAATGAAPPRRTGPRSAG